MHSTYFYEQLLKYFHVVETATALLARLFLLTAIREMCCLYCQRAGLFGLGLVLYFLWVLKDTSQLWETRSTPTAGTAVPNDWEWEDSMVLAKTLMLIFFKGWCWRSNPYLAGVIFQCPMKLVRYIVVFIITNKDVSVILLDLQCGQKFWSRVLVRQAASHLLKYLTLQVEILMRTAAAAYGFHVFWVLDIEKVWNKRLFLHSVSLLFMQTHMCMIQSIQKIWATTLGETVMHLCLLTCLPILNTWDLLCLRELYGPLDWKEAFLAIFFSHRNEEDFKLAGETAGMKIPSMEDRRAWNKLPTNDWVTVRRAFWQPAFAKENWNLKAF